MMGQASTWMGDCLRAGEPSLTVLTITDKLFIMLFK